MKTAVLMALLLGGIVMRTHGWRYLYLKQTLPAVLLLAGGTLLTLSIVLVVAANTGN